MKHLLVWLKRSSFFIKKVLKYSFSFLIFVTLPPITNKFVRPKGSGNRNSEIIITSFLMGLIIGKIANTLVKVTGGCKYPTTS